MRKKLLPLDEVLAMLEERDDICLLFSDETNVMGSQFTRTWGVTTVNPGGFNPVTREHWHYYAQAFVIKERKLSRKGELTKELAELATQYGRLGVTLILIDPENPTDAVIDRLGSVPEKFKDYLARADK